MGIELGVPEVGGLSAVLDALRHWQDDAAPLQLHPGDIGWHWRFGVDATAAAIRTWTRDGEILAVGFRDGPDVLRLTVAPRARRDDELAHRVAGDVSDPGEGVLPAGKVCVEVPDGAKVRELLDDAGWHRGEAWTPLCRDLSAPVPASQGTGLRVETVGPERIPEFTAVHRAAWGNPRFTDELWHVMASGPAFSDARCLLGYDDAGDAVAGVTVWSAGPGRPGLLDPMGVHPEHRGRGHGTAICLAAAAELRRLGSSSAQVCTPSPLTAAVATYRSAGFEPGPTRFDLTRPG